MIIARVVSHIVASAKTPSYVDHKILCLAPEAWNGQPNPKAAPIIALDLVDAGVGERVLVCQEGSWARETLANMSAPVRSMVVGIIEQVSLNPEIPSAPVG